MPHFGGVFQICAACIWRTTPPTAPKFHSDLPRDMFYGTHAETRTKNASFPSFIDKCAFSSENTSKNHLRGAARMLKNASFWGVFQICAAYIWRTTLPTGPKLHPDLPRDMFYSTHAKNRIKNASFPSFIDKCDFSSENPSQNHLRGLPGGC